MDEDNIMAEIEKGQQLAGHFPSSKALNRARRILRGEMTIEEARAEVHAEIAYNRKHPENGKDRPMRLEHR